MSVKKSKLNPVDPVDPVRRFALQLNHFNAQKFKTPAMETPNCFRNR